MKQTRSTLGLKTSSLAAGVIALASLCVGVADAAGALSLSPWKNGPAIVEDYFPIAVWLQSPSRAAQYRDAGINLYVGLWRGPTEDQLATLKAAGMKLICHQNEVALKHLDDPTIVGWMHGDEPDNAQSLGASKGYGPPIPPQTIVRDYERLRQEDPTRPVMLNLGQGVAWDKWHGRGARTNHPEDYTEYVKGADIVSFDIYPACHSHPDVAGNLWYVARGVERLRQWTGGRKIVWNCIECTRIQNPKVKATPHQVRAEVWMSLIHGSEGLIYFVHEWEPKFNEAALLSDPEMLAAVTRINKQIHSLARVLNQPTLTNAAAVTTGSTNAPVAVMAKKSGGSLYLFAIAMSNTATSARFSVEGLRAGRTVAVVDEQRSIQAKAGSFEDSFQPWEVHIYQVEP